MLDSWKRRARLLKQDVQAVALAYQDPRTPWYACLLAVAVVAYALSPVDLVPDFVPVLGYLDDLILLPLGVALVVKLVPPLVMADCRERVASGFPQMGRFGRVATALIVFTWVVSIGISITVIWWAIV
jgi:uncharacterized membrane protein YkvA (DUF1232 family)